MILNTMAEIYNRYIFPYTSHYHHLKFLEIIYKTICILLKVEQKQQTSQKLQYLRNGMMESFLNFLFAVYFLDWVLKKPTTHQC